MLLLLLHFINKCPGPGPRPIGARNKQRPLMCVTKSGTTSDTINNYFV